MKYHVKALPNNEKALRFKIRSEDGKQESVFNFCKENLGVWGNPAESKLKEMMVSYVKKNGWGKEVVIKTEENNHNLTHYIAALNKKGK